MRYLIGDRRAILELAASPWSVAIGFLFVLSAGLAREYDGEDLLHQPWYALLPVAASLVASFVLYFFVVAGVVWRGRVRPPFLAGYPSFLGLFWLTAPLAWLYAVPYERFLSPFDAARANLLTLAVVALWRVLLMIRVLVVRFNYGVSAAVVLVLAFGDGVALLGLGFSPVQLIEMMGGLEPLPENEALVRTATSCLWLLGAVTMPIWCIAANLDRSTIRLSLSAPPRNEMPGRPGLSLWGLAFASLAVWALVLPLTQPEQQLRFQVESACAAGRHDEMFAPTSSRPNGCRRPGHYLDPLRWRRAMACSWTPWTQCRCDRTPIGFERPTWRNSAACSFMASGVTKNRSGSRDCWCDFRKAKTYWRRWKRNSGDGISPKSSGGGCARSRRSRLSSASGRGSCLRFARARET